MSKRRKMPVDWLLIADMLDGAGFKNCDTSVGACYTAQTTNLDSLTRYVFVIWKNQIDIPYIKWTILFSSVP